MLVKPDREALISISQWIRQGEDWVILGEERQGHKVLGFLIYQQKLLSQLIADNVGPIMQPLLRQTVVISLPRAVRIERLLGHGGGFRYGKIDNPARILQ